MYNYHFHQTPLEPSRLPATFPYVQTLVFFPLTSSTEIMGQQLSCGCNPFSDKKETDKTNIAKKPNKLKEGKKKTEPLLMAAEQKSESRLLTSMKI